MTREEVVAAARRYLEKKARWRHLGRSEEHLDCVGLLWRIQHVDFGIPTKDVSGYSRYPKDDGLVDFLCSQLVRRDGPPVLGSVVVLRDKAEPCHVGIIGEKHGLPTLIHCSVARRGMHEEYWTRDWQRLFRMALDFQGVED